MVARDLAMARMTGGRLHLCHLSSRAVGRAGPPREGRGRPRDAPRSRRTTWSFTDDDLVDLRHELEDEPAAAHGRGPRRAARGLADGTIDAIATDHAPHAVEEKEAEFDLAPPGHDRAGDRARGRAHRRSSSPGSLAVDAGDRGADVDARRGSSAPPTTAGRSSRGARRTSCVFDPEAEWTVGAAVRLEGAQLARSWAAAARAGARTRCCAATLTVADGKATR